MTMTLVVLLAYVVGLAVGWIWGTLWAAGYVRDRAGVRPCELTRQKEPA